MKVVISALLIAAINAIAQRNAFIAGWIASLPLITLLSIGWLSFDGRGGSEITKFLVGVLWGLPPTALLLVVTTVLLTRGTSVGAALAFGVITWIACLFAARQFGLLGA